MPLSVIRLTKQLRALNNVPGLLPTRESVATHDITYIPVCEGGGGGGGGKYNFERGISYQNPKIPYVCAKAPSAAKYDFRSTILVRLYWMET